MTLTAEEKKLIYEEEKARINAEKRVQIVEKLTQAKFRFTRKHLFITGGVLAAITGGVIWYINWIHSPEYSLQQTFKAVQKQDVAQFQKLVEVDAVTSSLFDQAMEVYFSQNQDPNTSWANGLAQGFVMLMKPQVTGKFKQAILDGIANGSVNGDAISADDGPFAKLKGIQISTHPSEEMPFRYVNVAYTKKNGKIATVGNRIFIKRYKSDDFVLDVSMREMDGYWQVTDVDGKRFYNQVNDHETKLITELNKPILETLSDSLELTSSIKVSRGSNDYWGFSKVIRASVPFRNTSGKEIDSYTISVTVTGPSGTPIAQLPYTEQANLKPNAQKTLSVGKEINPFIPTDVQLFEAGNGAYQAQINEIKFIDGSVVKPHQMYEPI